MHGGGGGAARGGERGVLCGEEGRNTRVVEMSSVQETSYTAQSRTRVCVAWARGCIHSSLFPARLDVVETSESQIARKL